MRKEYIFPICIIVLNLFAFGFYLDCSDWRRALYFLAAAVLNFCVM